MKEFMNRMTSNPNTAKKFITAFLGALMVAITEGVLSDDYKGYVIVAIAFATSLGVYAVPNEGVEND